MITLVIKGISSLKELSRIIHFGLDENEFDIITDKDIITLIRKNQTIPDISSQEIEKTEKDNNNNHSNKWKNYTHEDEIFIVKNYGKIPAEQIAEKLGKTVTSIYAKVRYMKMHGDWEKIEKQLKNSKSIVKRVLNSCIHDCKNCQFGIKEESGNTYWCKKKKTRVTPDGKPIKEVEVLS